MATSDVEIDTSSPPTTSEAEGPKTRKRTSETTSTPSPKQHRSSRPPSITPNHQPFIGISGIIGAGKTTLAAALAEELHLPVYYEPVINNEYLEPFYKDMRRYGFPLQIYLLNNRFRQHQEIVWSGEGGVADRTIYEDGIFAKMLLDAGNMEERDYRTYVSLFNNMSNFMRKPDLIIHLDVDPEESMERIRTRSRGCESGITVEYLRALHKGYADFLEDISRTIPVLRVNWSEFHTAEEMASVIRREYEHMKTMRYVDFGEAKPGQ